MHRRHGVLKPEDVAGTVVLPLWLLLTCFAAVVGGFLTLGKLLLAEKDRRREDSVEGGKAAVEREKILAVRLQEATEATKMLAASHRA